MAVDSFASARQVEIAVVGQAAERVAVRAHLVGDAQGATVERIGHARVRFAG